jgi:glycosyltransferase involved in cell wall biosynthesis
MALEFILITPARNEEAFIGGLAESMISQTRRPKRWLVVSDGSTDRTDEIVGRYAAAHDWIELVRMPESRPRSFAAKAFVFNEGYARLAAETFDVVGNVDADVSFGPGYFEYLLSQFERDPTLGVAGTHYVEGEFHSFGDSYMNPVHVNGGCQLFRRKCFEQVGGYVPIPAGGVDWIAVTTARMNGWRTWSFGDLVFHHHRKIGTAEASELVSRFRYGRKDYFLGGHPLWQVLRGSFQMAKPPYVIGGAALIAGYAWGWLTRHPRAVSDELMRFYRQEQMARLRDLVKARRRRAVAG